MAWYIVYQTSDGERVSEGSVLASPLPLGLASKEFVSRPGRDKRWNKAILDIEDRPARPDPRTPLGLASAVTDDSRVSGMSPADKAQIRLAVKDVFGPYFAPQDLN